MSILALDPGTQLGWAVIDDAGGRIASGAWDLSQPVKPTRRGVYFLRARANIDALIGDHADGLTLIVYERVFQHSGEGIVITDTNGKIIALNRAFERITGYRRDEVIGKLNIRDVLAPHEIPRFERQFAEFKETGRITDVEFDVLRKDRSVLPVRVSAELIRAPGSSLAFSSTTMSDNDAVTTANRPPAPAKIAFTLVCCASAPSVRIQRTAPSSPSRVAPARRAPSW